MRRAAATVLISTGLLAANCAQNGSAPPASLVGAWRSSLQFRSGAFAQIHDLEFMYVFHADGTLTESSNYDAAPPVPPAYGIWRPTGPREFEARYEFFATAPSKPDAFAAGGGWLPAGRGVLTERITLAADGRAFTSTLVYEALGTHGEKIEGGGEAEGKGARLGFPN